MFAHEHPVEFSPSVAVSRKKFDKIMLLHGFYRMTPASGFGRTSLQSKLKNGGSTYFGFDHASHLENVAAGSPPNVQPVRDVCQGLDCDDLELAADAARLSELQKATDEELLDLIVSVWTLALNSFQASTDPEKVAAEFKEQHQQHGSQGQDFGRRRERRQKAADEVWKHKWVLTRPIAIFDPHSRLLVWSPGQQSFAVDVNSSKPTPCLNQFNDLLNRVAPKLGESKAATIWKRQGSPLTFPATALIDAILAKHKAARTDTLDDADELAIREFAEELSQLERCDYRLRATARMRFLLPRYVFEEEFVAARRTLRAVLTDKDCCQSFMSSVYLGTTQTTVRASAMHLLTRVMIEKTFDTHFNESTGVFELGEEFLG
jgi:hypothetical protein